MTARWPEPGPFMAMRSMYTTEYNADVAQGRVADEGGEGLGGKPDHELAGRRGYRIVGGPHHRVSP